MKTLGDFFLFRNERQGLCEGLNCSPGEWAKRGNATQHQLGETRLARRRYYSFRGHCNSRTGEIISEKSHERSLRGEKRLGWAIIEMMRRIPGIQIPESSWWHRRSWYWSALSSSPRWKVQKVFLKDSSGTLQTDLDLELGDRKLRNIKSNYTKGWNIGTWIIDSCCSGLEW